MIAAGVVDTEALALRLRSNGLRITPQRLGVVAAVTRLVHATPDQVAEAVPDIDLTTIYRTLETLEQIGVLAHTHLGHGAASYRLAEDDHVHVVCHRCLSVIDVPPDIADTLAARLLDERGFSLDRSHFTVFGTCASCLTGADDD
jgi:Fur family ferric uptake transcriptional regulator